MSATTEAMELARYEIERHEGCVSHAYQCPAGFLTIGFGRMIDRRLGGGITEDEAEMLLSNDIKRIDIELRTAFRFYDRLDTQRQAALINMTYNLGLPKLVGFSRMIAALEAGEWEEAADEALKSRWAAQVGRRAQDIATMLRGRSMG